MRTNKVISNYDKLTDDELAMLASGVEDALTGNASFPEPNPTLPEFTTAATDYRAKLAVASRKGSALEVSLKNEARKVLLNLLRRLAFYVNEIGQGNAPVLYSSGMRLNSQPREMLVPGVPDGVKLRDGRQSGQIRLDFNPLKEAWEYEYAISSELDENKDPIWGNPLNTTSSRANILAPVTPGVLYRIRVRARNGRGLGDWSEAVTLIAR
ncbi:hypothetical protein SAMN05216436_12288 [bacterium A37T11]|nr:hypothetical protein SAMN05216436_12288 [bacterium A37T11]